MSYTEARAQLSSAEQAALDELMELWRNFGGVPEQARLNLMTDTSLPIYQFVAYLKSIVAEVEDLQPHKPTIRQCFEKIGRPFILHGIASKKHQTAQFGRAIALKKYVRYLRMELNKLGRFDSIEDVEHSVRRLSGNASPPASLEDYLEAIKRTALGKDALFATFAHLGTAPLLPWSANTPSGNEVRNILGLGADPPDVDYLLFAYRLPDEAPARAPTSTSCGWFYQEWFRSNPNAYIDCHGWIAPLDDDCDRWAEIVHPPIDGTHLEFPFQIAVS